MSYKWEIDKSFNFEYGHRVWNQQLDHKYLSISTECACKRLHGHSVVLKIFLGANELDSSSMVTDFKNLNFMKEFIDHTIDHKFIIDINDPNFTIITGIKFSELPTSVSNFSNLLTVLGDYPVTTELATHYESFVLVNFVPTSENLCKYLAEYAQSQIGDVATVTAAEFWETPKSHCRYVL